MKKTSLYIEPEVDAALTRKAEAQGISKAELIRRTLSAVAEDAPAPRFTAIGLVDASLVALAAHLGTIRIATFDERHVRTLKPLTGEDGFTLLPADAD